MANHGSSDPYLRSFQDAFRPELEVAVHACCPDKMERVLDCPCGDGFYTGLFASHLVSGTLTAVDVSRDCVTRAHEQIRPAAAKLKIEFHEASAYALPYEDNSFDFVWCAQSFITLDHPVRVLREFGRVVRPGKQVAVLETDEFHHVLLPWPVELELAVFRAVRAQSRVRYGVGDKFAQSRKLRAAFLEADLVPNGRRTVVADRSAPFARPEREFLTRHFDYLREFVRPELTYREMELLDRETDPSGEESLFNRPDGELTCLAAIAFASKKDPQL